MRYPLAPMILGVILGPMADENLRKAIMIFQGQEASLLTILSRPVETIMLIVSGLNFTRLFLPVDSDIPCEARRAGRGLLRSAVDFSEG